MRETNDCQETPIQKTSKTGTKRSSWHNESLNTTETN